MKQITSEEFKKAVAIDPAWATTLTEPVEITEYCDMTNSPITHLSPLLHFTGQDETGFCVHFPPNTKVKVVEGTFHGFANFGGSQIERIGQLTVVKPDHLGSAASFRNCPRLQAAEGSFAGFVDFSNSGVETMKNLRVTKACNSNCAAYFIGCKNLKVAEGTFPGYMNFSNSGIREVRDLGIHGANASGIKADFTGCDVRLPKQFLGSEYDMEPSARQKNLSRIASAGAQKANPDIEI